jgi:hypothetical protein
MSGDMTHEMRQRGGTMTQQNLNFRTRPLIDELKEADKRRQLKSQHYQDRTRLEWMLRDFKTNFINQNRSK